MDNNRRVLRAALYSRVSREEQVVKGYSIQAQKENLEEHCIKNRYKIVGHYSDEGVSGAKPPLKRPALKRLIDDVEAGKIDVIVFTKIDRWFRSVASYYRVQEILDKNEVAWETTLETYDTTTSSGKMALNILLAVAENERNIISDRIKFVFENKRKNKEAFFGKHSTPFGYIEQRDENGVRRLVKDPDVKDALEMFWDIAVKYENVNKAAKTVNLEFGLTRNKNKWYDISKNEIYHGTYRGIDDYCPPYVSKENFIKLQNRNRIKQTKGNRVYLFTGMMKCPVCGNNLASTYCKQKRKNGKTVEYFSYRCQYKDVKVCSNRNALSEKKVEKWLLDNLGDLMRNEIAKVEVAKSKPKPKPNTNIPVLKEQLRRLDVIYMAGNKSDEEYIQEQAELKAAIKKAEDETPVNLGDKDVSGLKEMLETDFLSIYDTLDAEEKRRFWRSLIKEIHVKGNDVVSVDFL